MFPMGNEFISDLEPVTITTIGDEENIYWAILRGEHTFLRSIYRIYTKKSWTQNAAKAMLFNTQEAAENVAKEKFQNVKIEQ